MFKPVTIVALGKYADVWRGFSENIDKYAPGIDRVFVRDGHLIPELRDWKVVQGPKKFSMAGNANLGWKNADPDHDILYLGDDVRLVTNQTVEILRNIAYLDQTIGILSPKIIGGADNELQKNPPKDKPYVFSERYLPFICTYIKREVLDKVGYLDESFVGYGDEDADYCRRVKNAEYRLAVTSKVEVTHGLEHNGTETFLRNLGGYDEDLEEMVKENDKRYFEKWGDLYK